MGAVFAGARILRLRTVGTPLAEQTIETFEEDVSWAK
jgi:hypothetical protein